MLQSPLLRGGHSSVSAAHQLPCRSHTGVEEVLHANDSSTNGHVTATTTTTTTTTATIKATPCLPTDEFAEPALPEPRRCDSTAWGMAEVTGLVHWVLLVV